MKNLPAYIVLLPLCSALLSLALSKIHKHLGRGVVFGALAGSLVLSVVQLVRVIQNGPIHYVFGGYKIPYGIIYDNACKPYSIKRADEFYSFLAYGYSAKISP